MTREGRRDVPCKDEIQRVWRLFVRVRYRPDDVQRHRKSRAPDHESVVANEMHPTDDIVYFS